MPNVAVCCCCCCSLGPTLSDHVDFSRYIMSSSSSSVESVVVSGNEVSGAPSFILPDGLMHIIRFHRALRLLLPPLPDSPTSANAEPSTFHRMTFTDRLLPPKLCIVLSFFRPLTSQSAFFKLGARNPIAPTKSYTATL